MAQCSSEIEYVRFALIMRLGYGLVVQKKGSQSLNIQHSCYCLIPLLRE